MQAGAQCGRLLTFLSCCPHMWLMRTRRLNGRARWWALGGKISQHTEGEDKGVQEGMEEREGEADRGLWRKETENQLGGLDTVISEKLFRFMNRFCCIQSRIRSVIITNSPVQNILCFIIQHSAQVQWCLGVFQPWGILLSYNQMPPLCFNDF